MRGGDVGQNQTVSMTARHRLSAVGDPVHFEASFQSAEVRTAILFRSGVLIALRLRPWRLVARADASSRSMVAALAFNTPSRISVAREWCPYRSIASKKTGIAGFSRLPPMRSAASQRIVNAWTIATSYSRDRAGFAASLAGCRKARIACLR